MTQSETVEVSDSIRIRRYFCKTCMLHNASIVDTWNHLQEGGCIRKTHFFHGRYENLYVNHDALPGLEYILDQALHFAAEILCRPRDSLKIGFWLNVMREGEITTRHSHDDDDELLSGVYYIQVPEASGVFRCFNRDEIVSITPNAGTFLFFDPGIEHEVTRHCAKQPRISLGMNIGPA